MKRALVFLIVTGALASGCGGSSSSSGPLTKADFIQEANSICRDAEAERSDALRGAAEGDPGLATLAMEEALPPVEGMIEELGGLSPPASETKEAKAIIDAFEEGVAEVQADPVDPAVAIAAFAQANELAQGYGLTDCTI